VVNPNKIPPVIPPIRSENAIFGLNGTRFTKYHIAIIKSAIATNDPNATP